MWVPSRVLPGLQTIILGGPVLVTLQRAETTRLDAAPGT